MSEINIFDPQYVQKQQAASLQRMAAEQNAARVQGYRSACDAWVATNTRNRDLGLPITPVPVIPRKIVVTDEGEWKEEAFTDLVTPVLPPPVVAQSSPLRAATLAKYRIDQLLAQNGAIYALLAKIAAKVGV